MKIESKGIVIHLEQEEITDFWNIIMFALDWQNSEFTENLPKMTKDELKLANKLRDVLDELK